MRIRIRTLILFCFLIIVAFATATVYLNARPGTAETILHADKGSTSPTILTPKMLEAIMDTIKEGYVEELKDDKLLTGALQGMLSNLDPHSSYLNPKEYKELLMETKGTFGGLGMEVTMENGLVKVVSPIDDTPAQKAGIQPGDLIVAIDKKPIMGMTLFEAVEMLHGKPGTKVRIYIKRTGMDVFDKTLTRALIQVKSVKWRTEGNVGYIRIATFSEKTVPLLKEALADLTKKLGSKLEGLVLDVRNDPGGIFDAAVGTANLFLSKGQEIVSTKGRFPNINSRVKASGSDITHSLPIVVLINGGTASCPEILAGALQDHHRAVIVGTKSFGKGSVQVILPLTNEGALRLTIARYYTPSGRSIQASGIEPDIVVEQAANLGKIDETDRICEKDCQGALDAEKMKEKKEELTPSKTEKNEAFDAFDPEKKKPEKIEDYQLRSALDIVRALAITKKHTRRHK